MNVTTRIKMNLRQPDITLGIDAVQGDCCSRSLEIILYSGIAPWMIPDGITVAVRYSKPDGTKGYYDTLPNGSTAWRIHDNLLTVALAPQMLTVAGTVLTQIEMIQGVKILSTFGLKIRVEANPAAGCMRSEDYVSWLQWIKDESEEHVRLIRQSQLAASQAAESAVAATESANAFASHAEDAAADAKSAAASAASSRAEAAAIAADVSAIVAGNEVYTKQESDSRYGAAIVETSSGAAIAVSDSAQAPLCGLRLFGNTMQAGIPSPRNPVPFVNAGSSGSIAVTVSGSNSEQTLTISTPNGLPGIPVSSGGNYTDESGQQWICDEVDFAGGKYKQRIGHKTAVANQFLISENNGYPVGNSLFFYFRISDETLKYRNALCTKLPYNSRALVEDINGFYALNMHVYCRIKGVSDKTAFNSLMDGAEFAYILAAPMEHDLTVEELAAFHELHTRYPGTTIQNNSGAGMEVTYTADTKHYVDNQLAKLANVLLNT